MAGSANVVIGYAGTALSRDGSPVLDPVSSQTFATSEASSTQSTIAATAPSNGRDLVARVFLSETGWVWKGPNATANKTDSGIKVAANTEFYIALNPGDEVAILDDA